MLRYTLVFAFIALLGVTSVPPTWLYTLRPDVVVWKSVKCDPVQCDGFPAFHIRRFTKLRFLGFHTAGSARTAFVRTLDGRSGYVEWTDVCEPYSPSRHIFGPTYDSMDRQRAFSSCGNIEQLKRLYANRVCYHTVVHNIITLTEAADTRKGRQRVPCPE